MGRYFEKVAANYGLQFTNVEFDSAEDPGSASAAADYPPPGSSDDHDPDDGATFYVTHLREPVSRSISHFKYQGRWDCEQLVKNMSYVPREKDALKLETWTSEYGHEHDSHHCLTQGEDGTTRFFLSTCAVNCYSQWFSGLSCPDTDRYRPLQEQYEVAKAKLLRYNFIVVIEKLSDREYSTAIERFFGVPGVAQRDVHPWCEVEAQYTNKKIPVPYRNETLQKLTALNKVDIGLYHEMTDCLDGEDGNVNDFPPFDVTRFQGDETLRLDYKEWERRNPGRGYMKPGRAWRSRFGALDEDSSTDEDEMEPEELRSPSCHPHFSVALSDGNFTKERKFTRLYFYHTRKAGGTNLKQYFRKVAAHYGLEFHYDEYTVAEDPGSHEDAATFYVTNLRDPVARSISHFKYEGRWNCTGLTNDTSYIPTEQNARTLEEWSTNYGSHSKRKIPCARTKTKGIFFKMVTCGVMCQIQWFAGQSCPHGNVFLPMDLTSNPDERDLSLMKQYQVARQKLGRYNFIVISEWLKDPGYVAAVERLFGVPGVAERKYYPWCEAESHHANNLIPLVIKNKTLEKLTLANKFDTFLYDEYAHCLNYRKKKDFPKWDATRFVMNKTRQIDYKRWERLNPSYKLPQPIRREWLDHPANHKWRIRYNNTLES